MLLHRLLLSLPILLLLTQIKMSDSVEELDRMDPLYSNDSVTELLDMCIDLHKDDLVSVPDRKFRQCPNGTTCIKFCNEERLDKLREAQSRVKNMMKTLQMLDRVLMHFLAFVIVLALGSYLTVVKQFNWRTLPWAGQTFEHDPTDGYRYSHYIWMEWVILDSNHPTYYVKMTPDAQELEYIAQNQEWRRSDLEGDEEVRPAWSVKDLDDMAPDAHEKLEAYFHMVEL